MSEAPASLRVTRAHRSNYPDPISFSVGESLTLGAADEEYPGWIRVRTDDGREGWAPQQYLRMERDRVLATASYCARELDTEVGETLILLYELNQWAWVRNGQGVCGWVPLNTVVAG